MSSGATTSAGRAKKDWGRSERASVAIEVTRQERNRRIGQSAQLLRLLLTLSPRAVFVDHTHKQLTQISSSQKKDPKLQYWIKPPTLKEKDSPNQGQ